MILFLDYLPWKGKKLVRYGMIGLSIVVLFFHVNVITEITSWLFDRSPRPFEIIQDLPMERTYVTVGTDRYKEDGQELCAVAGAYSCASLMGSYYYGGYEPLLPLPYKDVFHGGLFSFESTYTGVNQKLHKRLRAMGVCDYIVTKGYGPPQALARNWGRDITDFQVNESFAKEFYLLQDTDCQGTYTEVGQIESLVRHGQGIDIELRGIDQDTVLHLKQYYLDRYRFLSQDGVPLEFTVDEDYRMMDIVLPKGTTSIHVVYHHPVLQWIFYLSLLSFMVLGWTMGSYFYDEYRRALPHEKA